MKPLTVIPTFVRAPEDLEAALVTIESLRASDADTDILVVDDCSPVPALVDEIEAASERLQLELHRKDINEGFSRAVNVGLRRALDEGRDAVLANADMEFRWEGWLQALLDQEDSAGRPAAIAGALLTYPSGVIQHAGIFFSLLRRSFDHLYRFAPAALPEAQSPRVCPVTGALQLVRHEALQTVGLYDEEFRMGFEDVDYCIRAFEAGLECVYAPQARAVHYESMFRGGHRKSGQVAHWEALSWGYFLRKWATQNFARWVPAL